MTKRDIAKQIAEQFAIPQLLALEAVQMVLDAISATLLDQGRIELRNFGIFEVKRRRARMARNLLNGQQVSVPARTVVTFRSGRVMKQRLNPLRRKPRPK